MTQTNIDLRELIVDRPSSRAARSRPHILSRYGVPGILVLGFTSMLAWAARESFLPAYPVTVVPVLASHSVGAPANEPLFQSAGWIEPRPTPVVVCAYVGGVIDRLVVVEGQSVKAGDPLAYLNDADAKLAVAAAEASLELQQAELERAHAMVTAAEVWNTEPIARQAELAAAQAELAKTDTELQKLPHQVEAAKSRQELARLDLESKTSAQDAVATLALHRARSELATATANVAEFQAQLASLQKEREALARRHAVLSRQLELKTEETRQLSEARANQRSAAAKVAQAKVALQVAQLQLSRMVVRAPIAGRVLDLLTQTGAKVMGLDPTAKADSSNIVTLYNPKSLQVRADVRLEDVPSVLEGQAVRIETPAIPGPITGRVLVATSLADIQKNTLQVKVAIDDPPPVLKPDMLVNVTFLAPPPKADVTNQERFRIYIPRSLVIQNENTSFVWIADQTAGVARQRSVTLARSSGGELVEVTSGLAVGDRVISGGRESTADGQRIRITREDSSLASLSAGRPDIAPATPQ